VPALRFGVLSLIGTLVYGAAIASIGYGVGSAWHTVYRDLSVAGYVAAAVAVVAIVAFVFIRLRAIRREAASAVAAPVTDRAPRH
jgi:membrane protein DedA with SNARE-associated domain